MLWHLKPPLLRKICKVYFRRRLHQKQAATRLSLTFCCNMAYTQLFYNQIVSNSTKCKNVKLIKRTLVKHICSCLSGPKCHLKSQPSQTHTECKSIRRWPQQHLSDNIDLVAEPHSKCILPIRFTQPKQLTEYRMAEYFLKLFGLVYTARNVG